MAIFHFTVKIVGRSKGKSVISASAYLKEFTGLCILLKLHNHTHIRNRDIRDFQDCFHIKLLQLFLRITTCLLYTSDAADEL